MQCHLWGKIPLAMQGYSHYLPRGWDPVWDVAINERVPSWAKKISVHPALRFRSDKLFVQSVEKKGMALWSTTLRDLTLPISSPERAMLELLDDVKNADDFNLASNIFGSMATLRPALVSELLRDCRSIKAKRLFLVLAEHYGYPWLRKVDMRNVELGRGKRQLIKSGKLHARYAITIPEDFGAEH
jgi:hypothetical protein